MIWLLRGIGFVLYYCAIVTPGEHSYAWYLVGIISLCLGLVLESIRKEPRNNEEGPYPWFYWIALLMIGIGVLTIGIRMSEFFTNKEFLGIMLLLLGSLFSLTASYIKGGKPIETQD